MKRPDPQDVLAAAKRIAGIAHRTPIVTCKAIDKIGGRKYFFKCENFQKVGAFKFRGALNAVMQLNDEQLAPGVVTHSSGNHAQALALAASICGTQAHIVMPSSASPIKKQAVIGYGANVIECEPTLAARQSVADEVLAETGGTLIHPYDHPQIIAGQGTAALELLEDHPDLNAIVAPVGGGGLISGTCLAASHHGKVRVIAGEPAGADDAARSKESGELVPQTGPDTIADGLLTSLGDLTWPFVRDQVEAVIRVEEAAIVETMRTFFQRAKLLVEPSSAVAIAAALSDKIASDDSIKKVGVIISGGNVDLDNLPW